MRRDLFPVTSNRRRVSPGVANWDPFAALQTEMNRMLDEFGRGLGVPTTTGETAMPAPRIDVNEDEANLYVTAELPGLTEQDVDVGYDDGVLSISGEKTQTREDSERTWYVSERTYGRFHRELPLGREIQEDQVEARFHNGVLTVTLPKAAASRGTRKIEVKRAA